MSPAQLLLHLRTMQGRMGGSFFSTSCPLCLSTGQCRDSSSDTLCRFSVVSLLSSSSCPLALCLDTRRRAHIFITSCPPPRVLSPSVWIRGGGQRVYSSHPVLLLVSSRPLSRSLSRPLLRGQEDTPAQCRQRRPDGVSPLSSNALRVLICTMPPTPPRHVTTLGLRRP